MLENRNVYLKCSKRQAFFSPRDFHFISPTIRSEKVKIPSGCAFSLTSTSLYVVTENQQLEIGASGTIQNSNL